MEVGNDELDKPLRRRRFVESLRRTKHPSLLSQSMVWDTPKQERDNFDFL
jgi:hypothetical protein